jgi:hypothetical protein
MDGWEKGGRRVQDSTHHVLELVNTPVRVHSLAHIIDGGDALVLVTSSRGSLAAGLLDVLSALRSDARSSV